METLQRCPEVKLHDGPVADVVQQAEPLGDARKMGRSEGKWVSLSKLTCQTIGIESDSMGIL